MRLDGSLRRPLCAFAGEPVHAVAGIGNPERFFMLLEQHGLTISRHPLPDHAGFDPSAPDFEDGRAVVMTEKDAVKLGRREAASLWYVPVDLCMDEKSGRELLDAIEARCRQRQDSAS